jgi:hypothetical protein
LIFPGPSCDPSPFELLETLERINELVQPVRPMGFDRNHRLKNQAKQSGILFKGKTTQAKAEKTLRR